MTLTKFLSHFGICMMLLLSVGASHAQIKGSEISNSIRRIENSIISTNSAGVDSGQLQSLLARMHALVVPGVSIAVFDQGQIIWAKGYGFRDKELSYRVDTSTIFQAASISKPVTSVAMFVLAEKNKIKLDEDVNRQLRSWKVPDNEFTTEEKVTPRRIVSHMAGLSVHGFYGYGLKDSIPSLVQILEGRPPANSKPVRVIAKPGTKEIYSGGGFTVLQLLLQEIMDKPFATLMEEVVLRPVGMTKSSFALKPPADMEKNIARGYLSDGQVAGHGYNLYPEMAAAGLKTKPTDLARFMLNVGNAYRQGKGILQQNTVQMMFTKVPNGGGLGFGIDGADSTLRFRHSGGNLGFTCYVVSFAKIGRGVVVMTNSDNGSQLIREIVRAISREYKWGGMLVRE